MRLPCKGRDEIHRMVGMRRRGSRMCASGRLNSWGRGTVSETVRTARRELRSYSRSHSRAISRMHPLRLSIRPIFLFPDRHQLLEPIDGVPARFKRLMTMRTTHGHGDADLSHCQMSQPMYERDLTNGPARA